MEAYSETDFRLRSVYRCICMCFGILLRTLYCVTTKFKIWLVFTNQITSVVSILLLVLACLLVDFELLKTNNYFRLHKAFRYLSHKFHGKIPGKLKSEKRQKKFAEDLVIRSSWAKHALHTAVLILGTILVYAVF